MGAARARAKASRRLQGVLEAHRDAPPVENERRLGRDLPQPRVTIREHCRRGAETDAGADNHIGEFARRIAIARKSEAMLRSIEIEHLAGDHFEIAFGPTMPAAQSRRRGRSRRQGSRVNFGICGSGRPQPRDTLANSAGPIARRASIDGAADRQQIVKQIGRFCKRVLAQAAEAGHIRREAAFGEAPESGQQSAPQNISTT